MRVSLKLRGSLLVLGLMASTLTLFPSSANASNQGVTYMPHRIVHAHDSTGEIDGVVSPGEWPDEPDMVLTLTATEGDYPGTARINLRREGTSLVALVRYYSWPDASERISLTADEGLTPLFVHFYQNHDRYDDGVDPRSMPGSQAAMQFHPDEGNEVIVELLVPIGDKFDVGDDPHFEIEIESKSSSPVLSEFFLEQPHARALLVGDPLTPPPPPDTGSDAWGTPTIDGVLDNNEWADATVIPFEIPTADYAPITVNVRVLNDQTTGYVAVELPVPDDAESSGVGVLVDLDGDGVDRHPKPPDASLYGWKGRNSSSPSSVTEVAAEGGTAGSNLIMEGSFELGEHHLAGAPLEIKLLAGFDIDGWFMDPPGPIPLAVQSPRTLTFMTFNMASETPTSTIPAPTMDRLVALADLIVAEEVDVLSLQEFDRYARNYVDSPAVLKDLLAERQYPMEFRSLDRYAPPATYHAQAVFSRYPIDDYTVSYLFRPSPLGGPEIEPDVTFDVPRLTKEEADLHLSYVPTQEFRIRPDPDGPPISVLNMHLPLGGLQCLSMARIAGLIHGDIDRAHVMSYNELGIPVAGDPTLHNGEPSIMMGDTNIPYRELSTWPCRGVRAGYIFEQGWVNACAEHQDGWEQCPSVNLPNKFNQIDQVAHRDEDGHLTLLESRVVFEYNEDYGGAGLSDHHPLLAKYSYEPSSD